MAPASDTVRRELELVEVGGHVALFRRDRHAVALLNASAAMLIRVLIAEDVALGDAQELLPELHKAGFFDPPRVRTEAPPTVSEPALGDVSILGVYRLGCGPDVRLAVQSPELAVLLAATLAPLRTEAHGGTDTAITVAATSDGLGVWRDGLAIGRDLETADARRVALQAMLMALHPEGSVGSILHASTVVIGGQAVVLAGASGSGKSTLALALAARGAGYLADDFTPLGQAGPVVRGFPVGTSVKRGSWPVVARHFPGLLDCAEHAVGERTVRYLDVGRLTPPPPAEAAVGALIFPRFAPNAPLMVEPLSPEAALGRLLASGSEVVGWPRSLRPLAELVNRRPAWNLSFGDLDQAAGAIEGLVGTIDAERMAS